MNGPEHYRKAEALILDAEEFASLTEGALDDPQMLSDLKDSVTKSLAAAQVHATLALAAATATLIPERDPQGNDNGAQMTAWHKAGAL